MPTKILAIDDSKTIRLAIKITFAAEDADVTAISKGSEAIARAKQLTPDVILLDARLASGEPSGYEICRALKDDPATAAIPVLMLVSNQDGIDSVAFEQSGARGAISKPFDTQELIDEVAAAVGRGVASSSSSGVTRAPAAARPAVAAPAAAAPAAAAPAASAAAARNVAPTAVAAPRSQTQPAAQPAPQPRPAANNGAGATGAEIPIAVPIPFTAASAPTPGMLRRLQDAMGNTGGAAADLDPQVAAAIVALSREVIEQVVWEVVPDLAESIIKERAAAQA